MPTKMFTWVSHPDRIIIQEMEKKVEKEWIKHE